MSKAQEQMEKIGLNPFLILIVVVIASIGYVGVGLVNTYLISPDPTPEDTTPIEIPGDSPIEVPSEFDNYEVDMVFFPYMQDAIDFHAPSLVFEYEGKIKSVDIDSKTAELELTFTTIYKTTESRLGAFQIVWGPTYITFYAWDNDNHQQVMKRYNRVELEYFESLDKYGPSYNRLSYLDPETKIDQLLPSNADQQAIFTFSTTFTFAGFNL